MLVGAGAALVPADVVALARRAQPPTLALLRRLLASAARIARCVASRWMPQTLPLLVHGSAHYSAVVVRLERHLGAVDAHVDVYDVQGLRAPLAELAWLLRQAGVRQVHPTHYLERPLQVRKTPRRVRQSAWVGRGWGVPVVRTSLTVFTV